MEREIEKSAGITYDVADHFHVSQRANEKIGFDKSKEKGQRIQSVISLRTRSVCCPRHSNIGRLIRQRKFSSDITELIGQSKIEKKK